MILTTRPTVEGRPIARYLDVVSAQAIMGVHLGQDIKALGRSIVGGRSGTYEKEFANAVREAKDSCGARPRRSARTPSSRSPSTTRRSATRCSWSRPPGLR